MFQAGDSIQFEKYPKVWLTGKIEQPGHGDWHYITLDNGSQLWAKNTELKTKREFLEEQYSAVVKQIAALEEQKSELLQQIINETFSQIC